MPTSQLQTHDVVIAGAGPVGLFLACELRLAGASVLVLEQAADPASPLKALPFGMRGLSGPTLQAFHRRGLLEEITAVQGSLQASGASQSAAHWLQQPLRRRPAGHFAGIQFFQEDVDTESWPYRLPSPAGDNLMIDMQSLERILAARATAMGAHIRRGAGVEAFERAGDGVTVLAGGETFQADWLVGCDGGRSTVRKAGGFDFVGTDAELTGYSVEVELAHPDALAPGRTYTPTGMYTYAKPGVIAMVDFDGGAFHRSVQITRAHIQAVISKISGVDIEVTALKLATTWTDRARQASAYRSGRVLLAGDAAHTHSPLGGQGLNLGLGDAMNLGWKLGATIKGIAPAGLLDSYDAERRPEGARILDWSRAQVALMRPTQSTRALESIIRDLIATRDGATYFAERVCGASQRYDLSDDHPLIGRSVPDFELVDGRRAGDLLHNGKGVLLDLMPRTPLQGLADRCGGRVNYVAAEVKDQLALSGVLVRPDGFVAWASDTANNGDGLMVAMSRWFGSR